MMGRSSGKAVGTGCGKLRTKEVYYLHGLQTLAMGLRSHLRGFDYTLSGFVSPGVSAFGPYSSILLPL